MPIRLRQPLNDLAGDFILLDEFYSVNEQRNLAFMNSMAETLGRTASAGTQSAAGTNTQRHSRG